MISKVKNWIAVKIQNVIGPAVKRETEKILPVISQLIEFQSSPAELRSSFHDHTKRPEENIKYYERLKDRLINSGIKVEDVMVDITDFERWLIDFAEIRRNYERLGDVFIEKCLEHYLAYRHLKISNNDVYIDVASAGSPWAESLNVREAEVRDRKQGVKAYRLDLSFPKGINGIDIGADSGDTKLPNGFASVLSLQCAYECFMGDADILFVKEASRILNKKGRYGIVPLYLEDIHFVSTSPYCNQAAVIIEPEARKIWRDDEYKLPFSRYYSPESFAERIHSQIPDDMAGKIIYFKNLEEVMMNYPGQRVYCFFMFLCEKKKMRTDNEKFYV